MEFLAHNFDEAFKGQKSGKPNRRRGRRKGGKRNNLSEEDTHAKSQKFDCLDIFMAVLNDTAGNTKQEQAIHCSDRLLITGYVTYEDVKQMQYNWFYLFLLALQENNEHLANQVIDRSEDFRRELFSFFEVFNNTGLDESQLKNGIMERRIHRLSHERTNEYALHYSMYYGYPSVTEKLLNMGCETEVFDKTRTSPWETAKKSFAKLMAFKSKSPIVYNDTDASNCKKKNGLVGPDNANGDDRDNYAVSRTKGVTAKYSSSKPSIKITKSRTVRNTCIGIVESAAILISYRGDFKLMTTIYYEMNKRSKKKRQIKLINAVVRFFGINRLLFELNKCSSETSSMCKERMLQLILRAEVDINEEAKQRSKLKNNKLYLKPCGVYFSIEKSSSLKKNDEEQLTQDNFDFLIKELVNTKSNHRLVCAFTDIIAFRATHVLDLHVLTTCKTIGITIKSLCEMLLLCMTHSVDSDSEMDSDDEIDLPDNKEECLLNSLFRMLIMFLLPRVNMVIKEKDKCQKLEEFLNTILETTFSFTFSILKLIFEEVASLRRLAVILKLYVVWESVKSDIVALIKTHLSGQHARVERNIPQIKTKANKSGANLSKSEIAKEHSASLVAKSALIRLATSSVKKHLALNVYANSAIHRHGSYFSRHFSNGGNRQSVGSKFINDVLRTYTQKKDGIPSYVCEKFVEHKDSITVILRSEPLLFRSMLAFLIHVPNGLNTGAKAEAVIASVRANVDDDYQWTLTYNRMVSNAKEREYALTSLVNQIHSFDKESLLGTMNVEFLHEEGVGDGLIRELFDLLSKDLFLGPVGFFKRPLFEEVGINGEIFVKRSVYFEDVATPVCGHLQSKYHKRLKRNVHIWLSSERMNIACPIHELRYSPIISYLYRKVGVYMDTTASFTGKFDDAAYETIRSNTSYVMTYLQAQRIYYTCVGRLIGLSILNRQPLAVSFPLLFFKQLLEIPFNFDDLEEIDKPVYRSLNKLKQQKESDFSTDENEPNAIPFAPIPFQELEIMQGATHVYADLIRRTDLKLSVNDDYNCFEFEGAGIKFDGAHGKKHMRDKIVTHKNAKRYADLAALEFALGHRSDAITTIRLGLHSIIPRKYLKYFTPEELKLLVCNDTREINLTELKNSVEYHGGFDERHVIVRWFWKWVFQLDERMKKLLLLFWSGTSTPPLQGFTPTSQDGFDLNDEDSSWSIRAKWDKSPKKSNKKGTKNRSHTILPSASTCSRELLVPARYTSYEDLATSMNIALEYGSAGYEFQ